MTTSTRSRALTAALVGVSTAAHYAVPDVAQSRAARGWLKAACLGVMTVAAMPSRDEWAEIRAARRDATAGTPAERVEASGIAVDGVAAAGIPEVDPTAFDDGASGDRLRSLLRAGAWGAAGLGALAGSTAAWVGFERWVHRRAESRAAQGVRFAHTRQALVLGALNAALMMIPTPDESDAGSRTAR